MKGTFWVALLTDKQQRGVKAWLPWYPRCKKGKRAGAILARYVSASGGTQHIQCFQSLPDTLLYITISDTLSIWGAGLIWVCCVIGRDGKCVQVCWQDWKAFNFLHCYLHSSVVFSLYLHSLLIHFFTASSHCFFVCIDHAPFFLLLHFFCHQFSYRVPGYIIPCYVMACCTRKIYLSFHEYLMKVNFFRLCALSVW